MDCSDDRIGYGPLFRENNPKPNHIVDRVMPDQAAFVVAANIDQIENTVIALDYIRFIGKMARIKICPAGGESSVTKPDIRSHSCIGLSPNLVVAEERSP